MPELLGQHELITVPAYRLLTVRDQANDAGVGLDEAITRARATIVASTGYELVITCAQDLLPVSARLETWSAPPEDADEPGWSEPRFFELECPSGLLVLSSPTGDALDARLPAGPGVYALKVTHQAREQALAARQEILEHEDIATHAEALADAQPGGFERYRIRMWLSAALPDEEDEPRD
ncbi:hypothetical protein SAMN05216553_11989 [Lentzea fradiae]|uniref:Uncharacterized protein n=1 Tax=Lentzea fradiae TaxID=200378 RepID=A0A1G8BIN0_9PSEU|nr:hypothetical protein [Lentzea fradiae]SDH33087.1 hypothetical protein SAMN05216553_11989 [Lentzea fradiae]